MGGISGRTSVVIVEMATTYRPLSIIQRFLFSLTSTRVIESGDFQDFSRFHTLQNLDILNGRSFVIFRTHPE